jgi:predicted O-linked N-acetylglucosamine transferase (SPINDLY family)
MLNVINEAEALQVSGRWKEATQIYQTALAGPPSAHSHVYWFNLGVLYSQNNAQQEAEDAYRSAIYTKPDFIQAWFNLGASVERAGRKTHAITIWQSMLDHPLVSRTQEVDMYIMVLNAMGRIHEEMRLFEASEKFLFESLQTQPDQPKVIQHWVHLRQKQCKWPIYSDIEGTDKGELLKWTSPLAMLSASDDPGMQLATAIRFVHEKVNMRLPTLTSGKSLPFKGDRKLRLGFLSSDFCMHAVSLLTVELFELLDKSKIEVFGFCWSKEDGSYLRKRVLSAMDHHIRIAEMTDEEAARCIHERGIDVLIDLQGITSGARPNILSYRAAPIQMTYLGFPGTTGHPCIDYVIADKFLIPEEMKPFYTEQPFYMPDVYQCSDRQRPVGKTPAKSVYNLPEDKFIFCTFNNNYKFTPEIFRAWMQILAKTPNSVFWLLEDNEWSKASLIQEAAQLGVAAERLIFAGRVAPEDYLARYKLADLFLDAYPFNGGTTANDALFVQLPVLTFSGKTFASRMAGSLLTALDMPELITFSLEDYKKRAIELGSNKQAFAKVKKKLIGNAKSSPLFNMPLFVKNFEKELFKVATAVSHPNK